MSVLLLNRSNTFRYSDWLSDYSGDVVLMTTADPPESTRFAHVERVASFEGNGLPEWRALELAERFRFQRIFAHSEYDLIRAGRLREHLGLPGQTVASATAYRNKAAMKAAARAGGVRTAEFRALESPIDLYVFVRQHGLPVVVKPVDAGGSRGVQVLRSEEEVQTFLGHWPERAFMVEAFVAGTIFHVDGVCKEGEIIAGSVSRYLDGCLGYQDHGNLSSVVLVADTGLRDQLLREAHRVILALPSPPIMGFHAEFFLGPDGELTLCEIASRTGGALVIDAIEASSGNNLNAFWLRLSCGLPIRCNPPASRSAGFLYIPPRPGIVRQAPPLPQAGWLPLVRLSLREGQQLAAPVSAMDHVLAAVVTGEDEQVVTSRIRDLERWFAENVIIEPAAA